MSMLFDAFVLGFAPAGAAQPKDGSLGPRVAAAVDEAIAAWPDVTVEPTAFARRLGQCAAAVSDDALAGLEPLRVADLYLAMGCAERDATACAHLSAQTRSGLLAAIRTLGADASRAEDLVQEVLARLVEPRPDAPARIATFTGRSSLRRWVRAVGVRHAQAELRRKAEPVVQTDLSGFVDSAKTPELQALRAEYRDAFKAAFDEAVGALEVRERNLIRQSVLDGLSVDALGELYGIHRSTAARWLERAKKRLGELTTGALQKRLALRPDELASMMRLTDSQLRVSLSRVFCPEEK